MRNQKASVFSNQTPAYYGDQDEKDAALAEAEKEQEAEGADVTKSVALSTST